jgi:hypothetical protein
MKYVDKMKMTKETEMQAFIRIAHARIRSKFPFKPQRSAIVGRMWRDYYERKNGRQRL